LRYFFCVHHSGLEQTIGGKRREKTLAIGKPKQTVVCPVKFWAAQEEQLQQKKQQSKEEIQRAIECSRNNNKM